MEKAGLTTSARPSWAFLFQHPAHFFAFGFGSGLSPRAPGTAGTLVALPLYALCLALGISPLGMAWLCIPLFVVGCWFCDVAGHSLGIHDYGGIVWDEIVAMLLILSFTPETSADWLFAFSLFRFFDAVKPWPIAWFDSMIGGGIGVMLDDIIAAVFVMAIQWGCRQQGWVF